MPNHPIVIPRLPFVSFRGNSTFASVYKSKNGIPTVNIEVELSRPQPDNLAVDVHFEVYATTDAEAGVDYTLVSSSPVTVTAGQTSTTIQVNVLDDTKFAKVKKLVLRITSVTNAIRHGRQYFTLLIGNTYSPPDADFDQAIYNVSSPTAIQVNLSAVSREPTPVKLLYSGATKGVHFSMSGSNWDDSTDTLTVPAGSTDASVTLTPISTATLTIDFDHPADNTQANLCPHSHEICGGIEGPVQFRDAKYDGSAGVPADYVFEYDSGPNDYGLYVEDNTGVFGPDGVTEACRILLKASSTAWNYLRKSFEIHGSDGYIANDINYFRAGGTANIHQGNNLFGVVIKEYNAEKCRLSLLDRTLQALDDPSAAKAVVGTWSAGVLSITSTDNLSVGNGDDWGVVDLGSGWYIIWLLYNAPAGEDGDIANYFIRPVWGTDNPSDHAGEGSYIFAYHIEQSTKVEFTSLSDIQVFEGLMFFADLALVGSINSQTVVNIS